MMTERDALRRLIAGDGETRICSFDAADRILAAGWRRIPPGGTEWEAMVDRAVAEYDGADVCAGADEAMEAALRAALGVER